MVEGIVNNCSDVIEEWGIGEIKESLEAFMPKAEDVEQIRASSEAEITNLSVLDAKAMEFSVISPAKLTARVDEQPQFARKGVKEIAAITIKGCLRAHSISGPEVDELSELSDKWAKWDQSLGKYFASSKE